MKAGVLGQVPAVPAHPAIDQVISIELLGAVLVVVLAGVEVLDVVCNGGLVHPSLEGALAKGALTAAPGAHVALQRAFDSSVASEGGDGDEAGILEAHGRKLKAAVYVGGGRELL